MCRATRLALYPCPTQSASTTRAILSLHENIAERSPPLSQPLGTAMTSVSSPANSSDRCARSFPAQSSMHPNGRATEVVHSSPSFSIFLNPIKVMLQTLECGGLAAALEVEAQMHAPLQRCRLCVPATN